MLLRHWFDWSDLSAQAWRVLLERQRQALTFFQLQADESRRGRIAPLSDTADLLESANVYN
jgi:hypothetical protein